MFIGGTSSGTTTASNLLRISGLATGLDTDNIIKQLMNAERAPLNRLYQKNQLLEWKKDDYRDITNLLRGFRDDFFDILTAKTNMTSASTYKKFTVTSSDSAVVTATANADAIESPHTISQITSLASAATVSSTSGIVLNLTGTGAANTDFSDGNNQISLNLDGVTKTVAVQAINYGGDYAGLKTDLQGAIDSAFGAGKITVNEAGGIFTFAAANSKLTLSNAATQNALDHFNIASGSSNRLDLNAKLTDLQAVLGLTFDGSDNVEFKINNQTFTFNKDTKTLNDVISTVNSNSLAGVTMQYSTITGKFALTAKQTGAGETLNIENVGGNLFGAGGVLNFGAVGNVTSVTNGTVTAGNDAAFTLDGVSLTRSNNTFTIDGINYTLKATFNDPLDPTKSITITPSKDVDTVYNNIKAFVDKYNDVISQINNKLTEKRYKDYLPLTDEQKADMSDTDIENWEKRAKSGLLRSDSILHSAVDKMRQAIYDTISGVTGTLKSIGIDTSADYTERGKLVIDETKLRDAIANNPDQVQQLFSKTSTSVPAYSATLSAADRTTRYNEEGIANRLYDIIQDNIRTIRDSNGKKGILIEKAGLVGDTSELLNLIDKDITTNNDAINDLIVRLNAKETAYYKKFTALEEYVAQMNAQSAWLAQQFSGA